MAKRRQIEKEKALAQVQSAFAAGTPFASTQSNYTGQPIRATVVLEPTMLFRKQAVLEVISGVEFDVNVVLVKFQQIFDLDELRRLTGDDLLVFDFNGVFEQRELADQIASAVENPLITNPVRIYPLSRDEWRSFKSSAMLALQSDIPVGHPIRIVPTSKKQVDDVAVRSETNPYPKSFEELSLRSAKSPSHQGLLESSSLPLLESSSLPAVGIALTHLDAIEILKSARMSYRQAVQDAFLSQIGIEGTELLDFVRVTSSLLNSSGLLLHNVQSMDEVFRLELDEGSAWLTNVLGGRRKRLKYLPEMIVCPIEELSTQEALNHVAAKNISLEPTNQVSKKSFNEFIEYFDTVHSHVDNRELARQFQQWLDDFPEHLRDFGDDVEAKRVFARAINTRAKIIGYRFKCLKKGCGAKAGLSVSKTGSSVTGQFEFKHQEDGNTVPHARSAILPNLRLVIAD
jgi:hypothetical protein